MSDPSAVQATPAWAEPPVSDRVIEQVRVIAAPRAAVWAAWSSAEGLAAWLAPEVRMDLRIGGRFEVLFLPADHPERGSEGRQVLAFVPLRLLVFSWNAPPHLPHARGRHTWVAVSFEDAPGGTQVTLTHTGWPAAGLAVGGHPDWPAAFAYFEAAWPRVMTGLAEHLAG